MRTTTPFPRIRPMPILLALFCLGALFLMGLFIGITINANRLDDPTPADVIIVLGAGIDEEGLPKPMLERRLKRAAQLYTAKYAAHIIVTGAKGADEPIPEALSMARYLEELGIPKEAIYQEDASYNTRQNLQNAKAIMADQGFSSAIVVSSDYHLWRALSLCKDLDIDATGAGAQNAITRRQAVINILQETLSWVKYLGTR